MDAGLTLRAWLDRHSGSVVSGPVSSRAWMAEAMGVGEDRLVAHVQQAAANPVPWREVAAAPVQDVVHERDSDLLTLLPVSTHNEYDSGPYIAAGLLISRDPEGGVQNVTIHRCQVRGPDRIGVLLLPRHTEHFFRRAEAAGRGSRWQAHQRPRRVVGGFECVGG